jgi:hypothetical protein
VAFTVGTSPAGLAVAQLNDDNGDGYLITESAGALG